MEESNLSNRLDNSSMHRILSNLPVKSLMRFRCVSKSWEALTYDPSFIKLHQSKSHPQLFIMMYRDNCIQVYTPKYGFQGGEAIYKMTIPWSQVFILKPVNGLFCFVDSSNGLSRFCNIGTRQVTAWLSIPVPSQTSNSKLWFRRNRGDKLLKPPDVEAILAFDVGTENFRVIPIPDVIISSRRNPKITHRAEYLLEVDGHIAIIDRLDKNVVKLWRSDDELTWSGRIIELPFECSIGQPLYFHAVQGTRQIIIKPSGARDFVTLYFYDIDMNSFRDIKIFDLSPSSFPYVYGTFTTQETLLPVGNKEDSNLLKCFFSFCLMFYGSYLKWHPRLLHRS
ncbi:hypothetical protein MKX03_028039 [Papaver bracteatum]|nr:hypothetical protein MKX03_028039 [Papaver bracteatum]